MCKSTATARPAVARHRLAVMVCLATGLGFLLAGSNQTVGGAEHPPVIISYKADQPGQVSANIYDSHGQLVRELLSAVPQPAGQHSMVWDGLDRDGSSAPAGDYTWKLLRTPGLKAHYVMSVGSNYPPGKDWRTACGPGTHGAPFGVAVDASGIYVAANTTENIETCLLKMTPDGKSRLWSALHPKAWDGALSLAVDGGQLFMLGHTADTDGRLTLPKRQLVYVYDATTGVLAPNTLTSTFLGPIPNKIEVHWDLNTQDIDASDMDVHNGVLVVAYEKRGARRWYHPHTGELLATVEIPAPQGVTVGADGVYVSTQDRIVRLSRDNPTLVEVVKGLDKPGRLDVDPVTGELFVYLQGSQQIQRYSAAGKLLNTYGQPGGRRQGLYDATTRQSFAGFADLCADGTGGFFVTESNAAPRRTAQFAADGTVRREWYGGQRWAPHAAFEGDNPNVLWVGSQYGWIMRVLADYESQTWTVHSCYRYTDLADGLVGDSHNEGGYFRAYRHDDTTYLALEKLPTILKVDDKNWQLLPVTVCGAVSSAPQLIKDWAQANHSFQWNDANSDGRPQQDEFTFYAEGIANSYEPTIAADFSCFTVVDHAPVRQVRKFPVERWNQAGAPIYGSMPRGTEFGPCPQRFDPAHFADVRWSAFLCQDPQSGRLFAALNDWTRDWCDYNDSFMQQWTADGVPTWTVSQRAVGKPLPGQIRTHLRGVAGVAHGCVVAIDVDGGWNMTHLGATYVWDPDGLFVGGLIDSPDLDGIADYWYQFGGESCHSSVLALPGGDVLFVVNWENEMRVYRITGWKDWTRESGTIHLTQPAIAHRGQGLAATYFAGRSLTKGAVPVVDPQIEFTWDSQHPAPAGVRWVGTILPDYGPAYVGRWLVESDAQCFQGAARKSRDNGAQVTFRFHGTSIDVRGGTGTNFGLVDFALDGEPQPQADGYSAAPMRNVSLFAKTGLPNADHDVTATVVGWYGNPRNSASSDAWVLVDKFIVDDQEFDDTGLPYTFSADADGKLQLWVGDNAVIDDETARGSRGDVVGKPIVLERRMVRIQLNYTDGTNDGGIKLKWSSPFAATQVINAQFLYPVTPGGYTVEDMRSRLAPK